ncbi:hypothetical protein [Paraclostridium sordellii]|uniref:hypothetical protein n=3 Tax=Paraclostridium sordellii TaxID=1505 RepID=UPI0022E3EECD|nr:hypothetical protein [Paeniclostridium sordellii]
MELIYIFFDDYNVLNNIEVNFGGEYIFKYCKEKKELEITKNINYIESFFNVTESNNIINVTGIIGENGSGKSTILDNIGRIIYNNAIVKSEYEDKFSDEIILSFIKDGRIIIFCHEKFVCDNNKIKYPKDIEVEIIIYGSNSKNIITKNDNSKIVRKSELLRNITCIYFSNIFDNKSISILTNKDRRYYDISINGILANVGRKELKLYGMNTPRKIDRYKCISNNKYGIDVFKALKLKQISDQIYFIINSNLRDKDISLPKIVNISCEFIHGQPSDYLCLRFYDESLNNKTKIEDDIYRIIRDIDKDDATGIIKRTFLASILDAYFEEIQRPIENFEEFRVFEREESIFKDSLTDLLSEYWRIWEYYFESNKSKYLNIDDYEKIHKRYMDLIYIIEEIINDNADNIVIKTGLFNRKNLEGVVTTFQETYGSLDVSIKENRNEIMNLLKLLSEINTDQNILSFTWRNISSGEYAMLEIYSRLYEVINNNHIDESIILIIDEGELYLHPEWQRVYIYKILKFLNSTFDKHKIQIVFASNTPLVITDIPSSNLVMLTKNLINEENISSLSDEYVETFASDINTLLRKSFFMKSTTGEFAKFKINEVLRFLIDEDYNGNLNKDSSLKIINSIGETVIRKKLTQLYNKKYQTENTLIISESEINMLIKESFNNSDKSKLKQVENNLDKILYKVKKALED